MVDAEVKVKLTDDDCYRLVTERLEKHASFAPVFHALTELPELQIVKQDYEECIKKYGLRVGRVSLQRSELKRHLSWLVCHDLAQRILLVANGDDPSDPTFRFERSHTKLRDMYGSEFEERWVYRPACALRTAARRHVLAEAKAIRADLVPA